MIWSRSEQWMLTGDDKGYIKYWQTNMNNVKMFQGHIEAIRGLRYKNQTLILLVLIVVHKSCSLNFTLNNNANSNKCVLLSMVSPYDYIFIDDDNDLLLLYIKIIIIIKNFFKQKRILLVNYTNKKFEATPIEISVNFPFII